MRKEQDVKANFSKSFTYREFMRRPKHEVTLTGKLDYWEDFENTISELFSMMRSDQKGIKFAGITIQPKFICTGNGLKKVQDKVHNYCIKEEEGTFAHVFTLASNEISVNKEYETKGLIYDRVRTFSIINPITNGTAELSILLNVFIPEALMDRYQALVNDMSTTVGGSDSTAIPALWLLICSVGGFIEIDDKLVTATPGKWLWIRNRVLKDLDTLEDEEC